MPLRIVVRLSNANGVAEQSLGLREALPQESAPQNTNANGVVDMGGPKQKAKLD